MILLIGLCFAIFLFYFLLLSKLVHLTRCNGQEWYLTEASFFFFSSNGLKRHTHTVCEIVLPRWPEHYRSLPVSSLQIVNGRWPWVPQLRPTFPPSAGGWDVRTRLLEHVFLNRLHATPPPQKLTVLRNLLTSLQWDCLQSNGLTSCLSLLVFP